MTEHVVQSAKGETYGLHAIGGGLEEVQHYPEELIAFDTRGHHFLMFRFDLFLASSFALTADLDVQGCALNMFAHSQAQTPVGSLPHSEDELTALLRIDLKVWRKLCRRDPSPLHKWRIYQAGDKLVWGHPLLIKIAQEALGASEKRIERRDGRALQERIKRLPGLLMEEGLALDLEDDREFIKLASDWFEAEFPAGRPRRGGQWKAVVQRFFRENKVRRR